MAPPGDTARRELLGARHARELRGVPRSPCASLGALAVDVLMVLLLLVLSPILLVVLGLACLVPIIDRLLHPRREYLDSVSAAYLSHVEEAVIHTLVFTQERVDPETVFRNFDQAYTSSPRQEFARLRQRAVRRQLLWPYFTDEGATVDLTHHYRTVAEPLSQCDLEKKIAELESQVMDFDRPLWELWVFHNYTDEHGSPCSLILLRIHHSMMDGFTGLRVLMQGAEPNKPPSSAPSSRVDRRRRLGLCQSVRNWLKAVRKLVLMRDDSPSVYKAARLLRTDGSRTVAWSSLTGTSVADLKVLGQKLEGATINDILLTALAGALKKYAILADGAALPSDVNACTWVSLSPLKHIYADFDEVPLVWGNGALGGVYLKLPIGPEHHEVGAADTLRAMRKSTEDPALMLEAGMVTLFVSLFGWLPRLLGKPLWKALTNKVTLSMSNVPGPQFALSWIGLPVRHMLFLMPPTGTISIFVTIATWNGGVHVGMSVDSELLSQDDLKLICGDLMERELEGLKNHIVFADVSPAGHGP